MAVGSANRRDSSFVNRQGFTKMKALFRRVFTSRHLVAKPILALLHKTFNVQPLTVSSSKCQNADAWMLNDQIHQCRIYLCPSVVSILSVRMGNVKLSPNFRGDVPLIVKTVDGLTEKKYRICSV